MRILHFSDFHLNGPNKIELSKRNFKNFLESVKVIHSEKPIDLIIFSGDMIDKAGKEYESMKVAFDTFKTEVIDKLLSELGLPRSRFAFVSGNHDIDRENLSEDDNKELNTDEALADFMEDQYLHCTIKRTNAFKQFQQSFYKDCPEYHHSPFQSTLTLDIDNHLIGVNCLDTSWRCHSDYDQGHILMGRKQFIYAEDYIKDSDLKIAVAHHDYSWMVQFEQEDIGKLLSDSYKIYLCGHNHGFNGYAREYASGRSIPFVTAPGLLYSNTNATDPQYRNGFIIIDYNFVAQSLDVYRFIQERDDKFHKDMSYNENKGVWHKDMFPYHSIMPIRNFLEEFKKEVRSGWITADVLEDIKSKIQSPDSNALQLIALSGLGKTRLVYEAFNDEKPREDVFYCDYEAALNTELLEFLEEHRGSKGILVVDNCPYEELGRIISKSIGAGSSFKIIGLTNRYYNQKTLDNCKQIAITPDQLKDAVNQYVDSKIPEQNNLTEIRDIKKMSEGFPAMAIRLVNAFLENGKYDMHSLDSLLPKILNLDSDVQPDEITVLSSLSLFQPVPVGNKNAFDFIVNNACITSLPGYSPIDKRKLFNRVIKHFDKSIIENTGTWLNVRPFPLAVMLASKWFEDIDTEMAELLVREIEAYKDDSPATYNVLKEGICERIKYMQDSPAAMDLFDQLTKIPFRSEKVVCSDMGSRLFLAMSSVNPVAVASCLFSLFRDKNTEWLRENVADDARRNLMWALEKLCFDGSSYDDAVKVMAKFALAENERFANNATGQLKQLFHIYLSGTQATLEERFKTIKYFKELGEEYKQLTIDVINSAFRNGDFVRSGGAEKFGTEVKEENYPSGEQVFNYWEDCRDLLLNWLDEDSSISELADEIVEEHCIRWCRDGLIDLMSELVEKIARIKHNSWPKLYESLIRNIGYFKKKMSPQAAELVDKWTVMLKPQDFVTKLVMKRYQGDIDYHKSHEEIKKQLDDKFSDLLDEFFEQGLYDNYNVIHDLCVSQEFFDNYFCISIHKRASAYQSNELFAQLLETVKEENGENLRSFFYGICSAYRDDVVLFEFTSDVLTLGFRDLHVRILASCEDDKMTSFIQLQKEFIAEEQSPDYIDIYLRYIGFCTNEMMKQIVETVSDIFPDKTRQLLDFVQRFKFLPDIKEDADLLPLFKKLILAYPIEPTHGNDNFEYSRFASELLTKDHDEVFAKGMCDKLIESMNQDYLHGNFEGLWSVLLEQYTDVVWDDFSKALVSDEYVRFMLQVKHEIGSGSGFGAGPMFKVGDDLIKKFCIDYPNKAPLIVANLCPVLDFEKHEDGSVTTERFSDIALWLFDEYGDNEDVLNEFHANLGSFSWTGSTVPYHERNIVCFKHLLSHPKQNVREWAKRCIKYEEDNMKAEIDREDYMRMHYS